MQYLKDSETARAHSEQLGSGEAPESVPGHPLFVDGWRASLQVLAVNQWRSRLEDPDSRCRGEGSALIIDVRSRAEGGLRRTAKGAYRGIAPDPLNACRTPCAESSVIRSSAAVGG